MRRAVKVVAGVAVALVAAGTLTLPGAEASGDSTIVVRGAALPAGSRDQLNLVGCDNVFTRAPESMRPMLGLNPAGGTGKRSLAFDLSGGNAVGPVSYVDQVAATTVAGMSAYAVAGTTGVAYVGYQAPADSGTTRMWIGRASLSVPAGAWTGVDVTGLGFAWTQYDMATHQSIGGEVGSSGIPAFVRAMGGDGAGFFMVGLGCDGGAFNTDAWRVGTAAAATTYDFEGYRTSTLIGGPSGAVDAGQSVRLTGHVVDDLGVPVSGARMVLQALKPGGDPSDRNDWQTVRVARGASVSVSLRAHQTTTYRWQVFTTPSTEGSASAPLTVTVVDSAEATEPPAPSGAPSDGPSDDPSDDASGTTSAPATPQQQAQQQTPQQTPQQVAPEAPASTPPATPTAEQTPEQSPEQVPETIAPQSSEPDPATAADEQEAPAG